MSDEEIREALARVQEAVDGLRKRSDTCRAMVDGVLPDDAGRLVGKTAAYAHAAELVTAAIGSIEPARATGTLDHEWLDDLEREHGPDVRKSVEAQWRRAIEGRRN